MTVLVRRVVAGFRGAGARGGAESVPGGSGGWL